MVGSSSRKSVCVVGSGIAGLGTAYTLAKEGNFEVTVVESGDYLGGHALTKKVDLGGGKSVDVDLGFQVFNLTTYPYLTQLFEELGVEHEASDMSFALSVDNGGTEWASHSLDTVFAQKKNLASPSFIRMMREVVRFGKEAPHVLAKDAEQYESMTLGEYLDKNGYSERFKSEYLLPTTAAIWSVPNMQMLEYPIIPLVAFMANHHLLDPLGERPRWRVVKNRSHTYVDAIAQAFKEMGVTVMMNSPVEAVEMTADGSAVVVTMKDNDKKKFDHVVLACHSDTSASMLKGDQLKRDRDLVSKVRYQPNKVFLHTDVEQMPKTEKAWASWNVLDRPATDSSQQSETEDRSICVTYWLNHLQNLSKDPNQVPTLLCTLNPFKPIDPNKIIYETVLDHPIFCVEAIKAQREINEMQANPGDARRVWYAGAWLGNGFHEDGLRSAVAVATAMSDDHKTLPLWARKAGAPEENPGINIIRGPSPDRSFTHSVFLRLFAQLGNGFHRGHLHLMLPDGNEFFFGRPTRQEARDANEPVVQLRVLDWNFLVKCVIDSDIGLGHAYMYRMFETDNLKGLFDLLILNNESLREALNPLKNLRTNLLGVAASLLYAGGNVVQHVKHLMRDNSVEGSRKNIEQHYDLGNDMYKLFLDQTMTYSAGIHTKECGATTLKPGQTELPLYEAQLEKLDAIIRKAELKSTDHVLEIGCGWGSFAIRAASTVGCRVTGITISTEQLEEAKKRVKAAGLEIKVNLIICDYRKLGILKRAMFKVANDGKKNGNGGADDELYEYGFAPESFDKIVSIEMLEAVGHQHLPEYFETVERMLKPNGKAVIQVISIPDERYEDYTNGSDFIREYIFPGGHLVSKSAVEWATKDTDLDLIQVDDIGPDYAITLRMWNEKFLENKDKIMALGYPDSWFRCWLVYFAYCESGFEQKYILDYHLTLQKKSSTETTSSSESQSDFFVHFDHFGLPVVVAVLAWISLHSLVLTPFIRQVATIVLCAVLVFGLAKFLETRIKGQTAAIRRKIYQSQRLLVDLVVSGSVNMCVILLVAFHEIIYTTNIANTVVSEDQSETESSSVYFCNWNNSDCDAETVSKGIHMYYIKSPLHFVAGWLLWSSLTRSLLDRNVFNVMHTVAIGALFYVASMDSNGRDATSAVGFAIIHGVHELHSFISTGRKFMHRILGFQMTTNPSDLYNWVWKLDLTTLLLIRWVPVPFLLYPFIVHSPWKILLPIIMIALRETDSMFKTLLEFKGEYENRVNTQELLYKARDRKELINSMIGADEKVKCRNFKEKHLSSIYSGVVYHTRKKLENVSPVSHKFKYNVWMALVDLDEAERFKTAFQDTMLVSVNKRNLFSWSRSDYYDAESGLPLHVSIQNLIKRQTGKTNIGKVQLLTNLRCLGFVFNPVSIYYCFDVEDDTKLEAVVLEVSNTPWLEKRMYVLTPEHQQQDENGQFSCTWEKDFHVSPFMDVFHNYNWKLNIPNGENMLNVVATSTRREQKQDEEGKPWNHVTGEASITRVEVDKDSKTTFVAGLKLKPSSTKALLWSPFQTFSVVLYIHLHAVYLFFKTKYQDKPDNARALDLMDLFRHIYVFAIAGVWETISFLFIRPIKYVVNKVKVT